MALPGLFSYLFFSIFLSNLAKFHCGTLLFIKNWILDSYFQNSNDNPDWLSALTVCSYGTCILIVIIAI